MLLPTGGRRRSDSGASAVEFALVAPLVLLLLFGIISYGYMLSFRQAMSQGAAEGARAAAMWATRYTTAQQTARTAAATAGVDEALDSYGVACGDGRAVCQVTFPACGSYTCARVVVQYPYDDHPLLPAFPLIPMPELEYTTEVRVE